MGSLALTGIHHRVTQGNAEWFAGAKYLIIHGLQDGKDGFAGAHRDLPQSNAG